MALLFLAVPLILMAVDAWKPGPTDEWTDRELQGGFWYRFLASSVTLIFGVPGTLLVVVGLLGGGSHWTAVGAALVFLAFLLRWTVIPALWSAPRRGRRDDPADAELEAPQPILKRNFCCNCRHFECAGWPQVTKGDCNRHNRKTLAYDACEVYETKLV